MKRLRRAFAETEVEEAPPASPEEAFQRFFDLMRSVMPVIEKFPRPQGRDESEPDELGFYQRWREIESRRRRHA